MANLAKSPPEFVISNIYSNDNRCSDVPFKNFRVDVMFKGVPQPAECLSHDVGLWGL